MKRLHQQGSRQIAVEEVPVPVPGPGEVLVKTAISALCGSEMGTYRNGGRAGNLGHEAAGVVEALGDGVATLQAGQRVGVSAIAGCGECDECHAGRYTWCDRLRFFCDMHAEYFVIPALACHRLPDDVPWDTGVLITGDGLGVPYHTSTRLRSPEIGTVAVFGLGPIGLGEVLVQIGQGRRVLGVDRSPERLALAEKMGAEVVAASEGVDVPARVRALTGGKGADACIEAAGVPATVRACFASVRRGGIVVFNGEQPALELSPSDDFIRRDITAFGSWFYHFNEYPAMLALAREGLPVASLITHRFPIEQGAEAFRVMDAGISGKVALLYSAAVA